MRDKLNYLCMSPLLRSVARSKEITESWSASSLSPVSGRVVDFSLKHR